MNKISVYRYLALLLMLLSVSSRADIVIDQARIRLPLPGQTTAVVYLRLKNESIRDRVLIAAAVDGAERAEMHQHQHVDGMMRMRAVSQIMVLAGSELEFRPHGYHIMVFGLAPGFTSGEAAGGQGRHVVRLIFADGEIVQAEAREFR